MEQKQYVVRVSPEDLKETCPNCENSIEAQIQNLLMRLRQNSDKQQMSVPQPQQQTMTKNERLKTIIDKSGPANDHLLSIFNTAPDKFAVKKMNPEIYKHPKPVQLFNKIIKTDQNLDGYIPLEFEEHYHDEDKLLIEGFFTFQSPFWGAVPINDEEYEYSRKNKTIIRKKWTNVFKIHYIRYGSDGPLVLQHHGVPTNLRQKLETTYLIGKFCRVVAIDFLGMGESSMPRWYGKKDELEQMEQEGSIKILKDNDGYLLGIESTDMKLHSVPWKEDFQSWYWHEDIRYIKLLMNVLNNNEKFYYESDDWGSGPCAHYAATYPQDLYGSIFIDPIILDSYPVKEIEAIGRGIMVDDWTYGLLFSGSDQTMWQIYKTMVHKNDTVYDQFTLKDIIYPYAFVDYENGPSSVTMGVKYHNLHVLSERASILSPALLLPKGTQGRSVLGVAYDNFSSPVCVIWGMNDNMMSAQSAQRLSNIIRNVSVDVNYVPNAGHFASTDDPYHVAETILNFIRGNSRWNKTKGTQYPALAQAFIGYFIPRWKGDEKHVLKELNKSHMY